MKVYRLKSAEVAKKYDGLKNGNRALDFALDGNGDLIFGQEVLDDPTWADMKDELLSVSEQIDYVTTQGKEADLDQYAKSGDEKYARLSKIVKP